MLKQLVEALIGDATRASDLKADADSGLAMPPRSRLQTGTASTSGRQRSDLPSAPQIGPSSSPRRTNA